MRAEKRRIITVLRESAEFQPRQVQALQRQIAKWAPNAQLVCLSDVDVPGVECWPLKHDWPGWWAKMEVFRPEIRGDFLLTDLDNVFLGPLDDILNIGTYTTQKGEAVALVYHQEDIRAAVWKEWIRDPEYHMHYWHPSRTPIKHQFGDGGFTHACVSATTHWEDALPGQVVNIAELAPSLKMALAPWHRARWPMRMEDIPRETRVLLCYQPWRPWRLPMFQHLYQ